MAGPTAGKQQLDWAQVCAIRLARHGLTAGAEAGPPALAVARMCGAHAQVMSAAEWSIGLRLAGTSRADIQAAIRADRSLVKTYGPRGTVHLLPAADLPMWLGALAAVPWSPANPASMALTGDQAESVVSAIGAALAAGELTMEQLSKAVVAECGSWAGDLVLPAFGGLWPRWRQALSLAAARGALVFGPDRGRKATYTSPCRWLPGFRPAAPRDAVGWLVREFLAAYGPATPEQFAQWLGAPRGWAREVFAAAAEGLQPVEFGGQTAWLAAGTRPAADPPGGARLLPYFDSYVVGCHPRRLLFPGAAAGRALSRTGQAGTLPTVLAGGEVRGIWHQRRSGRTVAITVELFAELTAAEQRELGEQAARFGEFLGCAARLTLAPVRTRSHL